MACLQVSVSQGWDFLVSVMLRVGMYVDSVLRMKLVKLRAAVEGVVGEYLCPVSCFEVELSEVQSAFLNSCTSRVEDLSCGVGN